MYLFHKSCIFHSLTFVLTFKYIFSLIQLFTFTKKGSPRVTLVTIWVLFGQYGLTDFSPVLRFMGIFKKSSDFAEILVWDYLGRFSIFWLFLGTFSFYSQKGLWCFTSSIVFWLHAIIKKLLWADSLKTLIQGNFLSSLGYFNHFGIVMPCAIWYHLQAWYHDIKLRNAPHIGFFFKKRGLCWLNTWSTNSLNFFFFWQSLGFFNLFFVVNWWINVCGNRRTNR